MPKLIGKIPARGNFFDAARLWSDYPEEFKFTWGRCTLETLKVDFPLANFPAGWLRDYYFAERGNYRFYNENGKIYVVIGKQLFRIPFPHGICELLEVFRDETYSRAKVKGTVLDVGAFIGDTAVYFASHGAEKVIAFEPVKELFDYAVENITLNRIEDIVELRNMAVAVNDGEATVLFDTGHPAVSSTTHRGKTLGNRVSTISLSKVIREAGQVDLLKLDCEGMEQALIPHIQKDKSLQQVKKVIMEVHGSNKRLISILESEGYEVIIDSSQNASVSLIFAFRNSS